MPISRYEIRNEYSLADPDLYRAADKDDPEALLEGVAMAGLVGLLRQLGDLAEFAAEIFHDLHEEVMATAARGHGLMVRVQQIESEVPSIEKAFLSQTDHSSFFYSAGADWHPNLRMDQNLVTQGDLPRFVMDSYEECRGPPRLFLLDKFDVAGAGACLKRYTDPSFFKIEPPMMTSADVHREKKIRKAKKKGIRWRNGGTPEVIPTSHAKLHQLFLEERVDNGVTKPARRVTLKRRLNGFPFDSRTGKSYMEKLLRSSSPEHKVLHEDATGLPLAILPSNGHNGSGLEVVEFRSISPERERTGRKRSPPDREEIMSNPSVHEPYENYRDDRSCEVSNSYPRMVSDDISYTIDNMNGERDISVSGDSKMEGSLNGYESDGIASEVDNYVDAPSTIGSEIDTDSELRAKSDSTSTFFKTQPSYTNEDVRTRSSYSKSTGDQTMSDGGINSSKKETSSFCSSGSLNSSAENPPQDKFLAAGLVAADVPDIDLVDDASSSQKTAAEDLPHVLHQNPVVTDYTCTSTDAIAIHRSDNEQVPASFLCSSDSIMLTQSDSEGSGRKDSIREPELEDKAPVSNDEETKLNVVMDQLCYPIVSDSALQPGDDYLRFSAKEHVDEELNTTNLPHLYAVSENDSLTDSSDQDNCNLIEHTELSNTCNSPLQNTTDTLENVHCESPKPDKVHEFPELHEECSSDSPDVADNAENILSIALPAGEKVRDELDDEDSVIFTEDSEQLSYIMKSSPGKDFSEASLVTAHNGDVEELYSSYSIEYQLSSENLILPDSGYSPDQSEDVTDAHEGDALEDEKDETLYSETPESCHVVGLPGLQQTDDLSASHSTALETSRVSLEIPEEPLQQFDNIETKCSTSDAIPVLDVDVDQNLDSADLTSLNEFACEVEQTENADMDSAVPIVSDHTDRNSSSLLVGWQDVEEHTACSTDSDVDELEDGLDSVVISHRHLGLMDGAGHEDGTSSVSCNDTDDDHLKIEVPDSVPYQEIDSNKIGSNFDAAATLDVQSGLDGEKENLPQDGTVIDVSDASSTLDVQSGLDGAKENLQQDDSVINVSDASSSPPDFSAEELLDSTEARSGLSPVLPVYSHEVPDHVDHEEDNSSGSMLSLVDCAVLPSSSELPEVNNPDATVTELPEDPLGSTFPPSNLCETTRINLDELPPLPPLPPVQWRMGKLLQGLSITGGERMRPELFPVAISPSVAFTDASSSLHEEVDHSLGQITPKIAPGQEKFEHESSSFAYCSLHEEEMSHSPFQIAPEIVPKEENVEHESSSFAHSSLLEEMNNSIVQIAPEIVPKEEKVDQGSSSFDATVMDEMIEVQPELENELLLPTSTDDVCSSPKELNGTLIPADPEKAPANKKVELISSSRDVSHTVNSPEELNATLIQTDPETAAVSKKVELFSSSQDASHTIKQIDLQPGIDNVHPQGNVSLEDPSSPLQNMNHSTISISPENATEQEKVQQSSSSEDNTMMLNKVAPRKVENEQLKLLLPFKVRELPLPAEEDGNSNEIRPKLPRPRNPLVNDVSALDKSKLRKVTERVRPPIEKVDERDSLLEQIRNKSFNLKPAMASRPSIRGPRTNLKVAAILEKANQIRQAFAGSDDEEDDDNWSDS